MTHYYSLNDYCREHFGEKLYKLSLDGGFTCPNRDGTLSYSGCSFCNGKGSGDFSFAVADDPDLAISRAKALISRKNRSSRYIAYFQNFSGTYAPVDKLKELYTPFVFRDDIAVLDIATRPDCLPTDTIDLLAELNTYKPVWVELGLQTIHEDTAAKINRGYSIDVYNSAVNQLTSRGIQVITHMIIGLPGESADMAIRTARFIGCSGSFGIKFHLLQILKGTALEKDFYSGLVVLPSLEEYIDILAKCIANIPPELVVHRITGDGAKKDLIAPLWCGDKKHVLNEIRRAFDFKSVVQGSDLN